MDIKIVGEDDKIEKSEKLDVNSHKEIEGPIQDQLSQRAVTQVLGLDENGQEGRFKKEIETLVEYAKSRTEDYSPENLKWIIRQLELKVGTPPFGEHRARYLARYAFLHLERKKIDKEIKTFE